MLPPMGYKILIIDDEEAIRFSLRGVLEDEGHEVLEAATGEEALEILGKEMPDLLFLDIWLPGMDGLSVLEAFQPREGAPPVIVISGHGNIETAVSAIKKGAFDFIEKPLSLEKVVITTNKALEFHELQKENLALRSNLRASTVQNFTGSSAAIESLRQQVARVAPTDAWVLITGENGTGKEILARSIHNQSRRSRKAIVAVNCAAIPEELIESELFGHEKGSFTGADSAQAGKFEMAHKGTLFLDEIGDMSLKTQAKILRILQEQVFERVGGRKTIRVDVRVIAATNKNLEEQIRAGAFREDLYYRLKVFPLEVPPLRARTDDIPLFIDEFSARLTRESGLKSLSFSPEAMDLLKRYPWPGNVRELKNFIERMQIMYMGSVVTPEQLPAEFLRDSNTASIAPMADAGIESGMVDFKAARAQFEIRFLEAKLKECGGNVAALAEAINMERSYLYRKLKTYGISVSE